MISYVTNASEAVESKNADAFLSNSYIKVGRFVFPFILFIEFHCYYHLA